MICKGCGCRVSQVNLGGYCKACGKEYATRKHREKYSKNLDKCFCYAHNKLPTISSREKLEAKEERQRKLLRHQVYKKYFSAFLSYQAYLSRLNKAGLSGLNSEEVWRVVFPDEKLERLV